MEQANHEQNPGLEIAPGVWYGGLEQLAQAKVQARVRLLAMPPEQAQQLVEQTLFPQCWDVRLEDLRWSESLPTDDWENDDEAKVLNKAISFPETPQGESLTQNFDEKIGEELTPYL